MARAEGTFRVQGPPRLDDASSWSNYKKRLAILKACKMSEMHMGALNFLTETVYYDIEPMSKIVKTLSPF